jgi:hypothetical protein
MKQRRIASIIRIEPTQVLLWWEGKAHIDLLTFDAAGRKLMFQSLGESHGVQSDLTRENVKCFLENWLLAFAASDPRMYPNWLFMFGVGLKDEARNHLGSWRVRQIEPCLEIAWRPVLSTVFAMRCLTFRAR